MHITLYLHKVIEVQNSFVWIPLSRRERDGAMKKSESICKYGFDCTEIKKVEHPECVQIFYVSKQRHEHKRNGIEMKWQVHEKL